MLAETACGAAHGHSSSVTAGVISGVVVITVCQIKLVPVNKFVYISLNAE